MYIKRDYEFEDMDDILYGCARQKWLGADDQTKLEVWRSVQSVFDGCAVPDLVTVNDYIGFECDSLFGYNE